MKKNILAHKKEIAFSCYFVPVLLASVVSSAVGGAQYGFVLFYTAVFYSSVMLVPKIGRFVDNFTLNSTPGLSRKSKIEAFAFGFLASFGVLAFTYVGFMPGVFLEIR